jgi:NADH-quinone oxidoreductase subunit J
MSVAFYILAGISALGAVLTVTRRNPLAAALSLALTMIGLAGLFLLLQGYLLFVLQILVYAGAVVVLIIFVIMLLNLQERGLDLESLRWRAAVVPLVLLVALFLLVVGALKALPPFPEEAPPGYGTVAWVGEPLFTRFALPFEVVGLILLVAIVGAVVLAKKGGD